MPEKPKSALFLGYFSSQQAGLYRFITEDIVERLPTLGWRVFGASGQKNRLLRMLDVLATIWSRRHDYQIATVDVFSGLAFVQAELSVWLLRRLKKPIVLTLHGGNLPAFSEQNPERVRRLLGAAQCVTAPSDYLREALRPLRDDIRLVPNAIDLSQYHGRLRQNPAPRLLWLRAMHEIYNPVLAVHIVDCLRERYPHIHLWIVGPDKGDGTLEKVKQAIAALQLDQQIEIVGGVPKAEVPAWMDKADILLNTTNVDNTPVSLIEAMASGLCIVSTNVGGIPALVHDGQEGLLVPAEDAGRMAEAVVRVMEEPGLGASLSRQAQAAARRFDWEMVLRQWHEVLVSALHDASAGGA